MINISRFKDKLIGMPWLLALSGMTPDKKHEIQEEVTSVGILCLNSASDIVLALPFFIGVKCRFPNCKITIFTSEENMRFMPLIDDADEIIKLNVKSINECIETVKSASFFDVWIDMGVWSHFEAILSFKAQGKYKIGFKSFGEMRHFAYDRVADFDINKHMFENLSKLFSLLWIKIDAELYNASKTNKGKSKTVVINMFADYEKDDCNIWDMANWKKLIESLSKKGYKISIIGDKFRTSVADKLVESLNSSTDVDYLVGRLDAQALYKLLSQTETVISVDSFVLYLGRYAGASAVGLFGPTYPGGNYFANGGKNHAHLAKNPCIGCRNKYGDEKCVMKKPVCMNSIDYEEVEKSVLKISERVNETCNSAKL